MKKLAKYDEEELEILQAWEAGKLKPVEHDHAQFHKFVSGHLVSQR
jgi:hypothetical protein